jgi:hypothetical protein
MRYFCTSWGVPLFLALIKVSVADFRTTAAA